MKYDIFISNSPQDDDQVQSLIESLRQEIPQISIWYDSEGIRSGEVYNRTKISKAINESDTVIFIASTHSYDSEICEKELLYAARKKKTIIPYMLPGIGLDCWLLFEFGDIECVHASMPEEVNQMMQELKEKFGSIEQSTGNTPRETMATVMDTSADSDTGNLKTQTTMGEGYIVTSNNKFINGHEFVDLGLPSGLKWATCNIGAISPEEYGDYFAWGETITKNEFFEDNCETHDKDEDWLWDNGYLYGEGDLTNSHDVASQIWEGTWRLPNVEEIDELIEHTSSTWMTFNGVYGQLLRSKLNGKTIFFPAAGYRSGKELSEVGVSGSYWGSTPDNSSHKGANGILLNSDKIKSWDFYYRDIGITIRPVSF